MAWHDIVAYCMYCATLQIISLPGFPKSVLPEGAHDGIGVCCAFSGSGHVGHVVIQGRNVAVTDGDSSLLPHEDRSTAGDSGV